MRNESAGSVHGHHTSKFQVDDSVLHLGTAMHTDFALHFLSNKVSGSSREEL